MPTAGAIQTGSLTTAREYHTATLLTDGRVLIAGGGSGSGVAATAEIYDAQACAFSPTGLMTTVRIFHTATLLPDGRVLLAGGTSGPEPVATADLFDPNAGTFSPTGSMATARVLPAATLLPDGRVLIAGGGDGAAAVATAELYDPRTGTFGPTGSMTTGRYFPTATVLLDGRVLVTGGSATSSSGYLATAEVYEPRTGTFAATGSMSGPHGAHTATPLPDGRVLIAGGRTESEVVASAELYDPETGTFGPTGPMTIARRAHTATPMPDGRVLMAGGSATFDASGALAPAEIYDPQTGTFGPTGPMTIARVDHTATPLSDGRVLIAGGDNGTAPVATAELWDPGVSASACLAPSPSPSPSPRATSLLPADDGARVVQVETVDARTRDLTVESPVVGTVRVRLVLPSGFDARPATRRPVLYLLHGAGGDSTTWTSSTDVEALTAMADLLVVMPDGRAGGVDGWYTDWYNGGAGGPPAWETFHLTELRQLLVRNWGASDRRAVAGLSMGGYGAMAYAARNPGMFRAAASYSGVVSIGDPDFRMGPAVWGDKVTQADVWAQHNPVDLAEALRGVTLYVSYGNGEPGPLDPPGTVYDELEGSLAVQNKAFVARLHELGIPATVDAYGPGTHSWPYWQRALQRSLPMLLEALGEGGA